jgi:uncharacterized protein YjbI with pentapeptide repeats
MIKRERGILLSLDFNATLFNHILREAGVPGWNRFATDLFNQNLTAVVWKPTDRPPLLDIGLDFSWLKAQQKNLDGIDLSLCWLQGSNFDQASLKGAKIGCCPKSSFRGTNLQGATFYEITGCDFTGAYLDGVVFTDATYDPSDPPIGLTAELRSVCTADAKEVKQNMTHADQEDLAGFTEEPLDCSATILLIPVDG